MAKAKLSAKQRAILETHKPIPTLKDVQKMLERNPTFYRELGLARKRVGLESVDRVRWLLSFVDKDIGRISRGQETDLRYEILAFSSPPKPKSPQERQDSTLFLLRSALHLDKIEASGKEVTRDDRLSWLSIEEIHSRLKQKLDGFFSLKGWKIERPPITEEMIFDPRHGTTMKIVSKQSRTPDLINLIIIWAFDLVYSERERLGICKSPRCQRRFVALRKERAKFCSPRCSAYVRVSKKRGTLQSQIARS